MTDAQALIAERGKTHGAFAENARISQAIKAIARGVPGWLELTDVQREALEMIALKLSRILSGNPHEVDHWDDVAGYAALAARSCSYFPTRVS